MKITKVEYDFVEVDETMYRRHPDGRWQQDESKDDFAPIHWGPVGVDLSVDLEIQYHDEKEPPRPTMGQMTEEHVKELARVEFSLLDEDIVRVVSVPGAIRLDWKDEDTEGEIRVDNDSVRFIDDNGGRPQYAGLFCLRLIASWGYDVMMVDER